MGDKDAQEARRKKLRHLEQSLFGADGETTVGLPKVKAVDEYHEAGREAATFRSKPDTPDASVLQNLPRFYKEPKKKVRGLVEPRASLGTSSSSSERESKLGDWEEEPSAPPLSTFSASRPKTASASQLLAEELEGLERGRGIGKEVRGGTGRAKQSSLRRQAAVDRQVSYTPSMEGDRRVVEVEEKSVRWDRATLLVGDTGEETAGQLGGFPRGGGLGKKSEQLLNKEQDELSQSLSSAKFQLLKNANLERVKQLEQRLGREQDEEAVVARKVVSSSSNEHNGSRPTTSGTFRDMPNVYEKMPADVYHDMPGDTFKDIPNDVFEDIPRAVTARARNRERLKPQSKGGENIFESKEVESEVDYTASAPLEEMGGQSPEHMGFIAMLFAGPNLPREVREESSRQLEKDFMFALFIQKQEEATSMSGNPGSRGERDPTVGHFCAPFCPGFCEANLCIFHTSN